MAGMIDKGPELLAGHGVAPDIIARQSDFVWRGFVRVGARVLARIATDDTRTSRDFDKAQPWVIGQVPGIRAEAWIAEPSQLIAGSDPMNSAQLI
jgi:hypothetical protein